MGWLLHHAIVAMMVTSITIALFLLPMLTSIILGTKRQGPQPILSKLLIFSSTHASHSINCQLARLAFTQISAKGVGFPTTGSTPPIFSLFFPACASPLGGPQYPWDWKADG